MFREYCFGEENSLSLRLTEFWGKLGEFCENLSELAFATQTVARKELTEFSR